MKCHVVVVTFLHIMFMTFISDHIQLFNLGWNNNTLCTGTLKSEKTILHAYLA